MLAVKCYFWLVLTNLSVFGTKQELEDSFAVTVDLLLTEGRLLKEKSAKLVDQAHDVTITANGAGVPYLCVELLRAMHAMEQADEARTLSSVVNLEAAATVMEGTVCTSPNVLRDRATELVRACVELKRAHDAMVTVQQAAAEQREARIAGAVGVAAASGLGEQPVPGQVCILLRNCIVPHYHYLQLEIINFEPCHPFKTI